MTTRVTVEVLMGGKLMRVEAIDWTLNGMVRTELCIVTEGKYDVYATAERPILVTELETGE